jgi:hypothetical protein
LVEDSGIFAGEGLVVDAGKCGDGVEAGLLLGGAGGC